MPDELSRLFRGLRLHQNHLRPQLSHLPSSSPELYRGAGILLPPSLVCRRQLRLQLCRLGPSARGAGKAVRVKFCSVSSCQMPADAERLVHTWMMPRLAEGHATFPAT